MMKRQIASLIAVVALFLLAWAWWLRQEKVQAEALHKAQTAAQIAEEEAVWLTAKNEALARQVDELRREADELEQEAALAKKLNNLPRIDNCTVSHYCCEKYEHICGGGDGITASGEPVQAEVSVAVETHDEALRRGLKVATVWWEET